MSEHARRLVLTPDELVAELTVAMSLAVPGSATVVLVPADEPWPEFDPALSLHGAVIIGVTTLPDVSPSAHTGSPWCDAILAEGDARIELIIEHVNAMPIAAAALVQLLRGAERRPIEDGLLSESSVYSVLQSGPEFRRWRDERPIKHRPLTGDPAVLTTHDGSHVLVTLNRPHVRNALNTEMRNLLVEAFRLVVLDTSIEAVTLRGAGPDYSAGGDLDEFGSFENPASAHLIRLASSVGHVVSAVADRVTAELHGACIGSGIEIPAFAGRIVADPSARFALPELSLGLVPGAGGTWSLPHRIGRHRTALLALTGEPIDSETALSWGLVDEVQALI